MLTRLVGLLGIVSAAPVPYFLLVGYALAEDGSSPADDALITGVWVLAGACALVASVFGFAYWGLRNEARAEALTRAADSG